MFFDLIYDACGQKLTNTGSDGRWDYVNGIAYFNNVIKYITTEEGRATQNGGNYAYQYDLKDHLGDVRVTFDNNGTARVLQEDEYYAFGLRRSLYDNSNNNRHLYNGKEVQVDLANQYDYGARFYDPVIGRWTTPDPLAEKSRRWSSYNYGEDNPIRNIDPDGMMITDADGSQHSESPEEAQAMFKQLKAQTGGKDGGKGKKDEGKKQPQGESFWHGFVRGIPGIGSGREYMEKMDAGDYWGASAALGMFTFDLFTLGSSTVEKTVVEEGTNVVYHSVSNGVTQYVGITNNLARREAEHLASTGINIAPLMQNLSRTDARAVEQVLIEMHGLGAKGGTLLNKINSIAASNPVYGAQVQRGYQLLKSIGYH